MVLQAADVVLGKAYQLLSPTGIQGSTMASHFSQQSVVGMQMCHLEKLEQLKLSRNALCDMPRLLAAFLRRLRAIDLSFNRFKRIPPVLASLTCLQHVDLSGNPDLEANPCLTPVTPGSCSILILTCGSEANARSALKAECGCSRMWLRGSKQGYWLT